MPNLVPLSQIKKIASQKLVRRGTDVHKGDFGRIFILAGSPGMSGAAYLSGLAAMRSGAGLVTVGIPKSLGFAMARKMTETMALWLPETKEGNISEAAFLSLQKFLSKQDVLAIGPGLSQHPSTKRLIQKAVLASRKPMVIDADGLNAFSGKTNLFRRLKAPCILTPHAGEFSRLFGKHPKQETERKKEALKAAKQFGVTIVLKGHHTVVASPDGKCYVNSTGNAGMATGGSGDVLTGMIAALLGQNLNPFSAACFGVFIHGKAGDLAAKAKGQISMIAGDIIDFLPSAFRKI